MTAAADRLKPPNRRSGPRVRQHRIRRARKTPGTKKSLAEVQVLHVPPGGRKSTAYPTARAMPCAGAAAHTTTTTRWIKDRKEDMADVVRYQVMPPLSADEYQDLYEDIKENGVLVPILVDENEVIIDGHHRSKIAAELGIPCPEEIITGKSEAEKRGMAFGLNLKRRHLNREQRRVLIAESLKADPQLSNVEHARRTGTSDKTVKTVRDGLVATSEIPKLDKTTGADGRVRPASQPPRPEPEPEATPEPEGTPEPTAASASMAPGFEPGDLEELNNPRPSETHQPRAEAITSQFTSAISDLTRVANRFRRIADDKNFPRNKEKVAAMHRHDLNRLIGELQTIADEIN